MECVVADTYLVAWICARHLRMPLEKTGAVEPCQIRLGIVEGGCVLVYLRTLGELGFKCSHVFGCNILHLGFAGTPIVIVACQAINLASYREITFKTRLPHYGTLSHSANTLAGVIAALLAWPIVIALDLERLTSRASDSGSDSLGEAADPLYFF